jgi:hypothetical protein
MSISTSNEKLTTRSTWLSAYAVAAIFRAKKSNLQAEKHI